MQSRSSRTAAWLDEFCAFVWRSRPRMYDLCVRLVVGYNSVGRVREGMILKAGGVGILYFLLRSYYVDFEELQYLRSQ